jgi:hypothetical protein
MHQPLDSCRQVMGFLLVVLQHRSQFPPRHAERRDQQQCILHSLPIFNHFCSRLQVPGVTWHDRTGSGSWLTFRPGSNAHAPEESFAEALLHIFFELANVSQPREDTPVNNSSRDPLLITPTAVLPCCSARLSPTDAANPPLPMLVMHTVKNRQLRWRCAYPIMTLIK